MTRLLLVLLVFLAVPAVAAARPPQTYTWCGTDETAANRVPDLELSKADQVRFYYAIPSDGTDNFLASANGIVNDAAWIDQWWRVQDPTRTPRFDRYAFPGCTSTWGQLDIGFIRLPHPSSYYAAPESPSLLLDNDLAGTLPGTQKSIVYFDGPTHDSQVCGETDYLADHKGGDNGITYVYPRSGCALTPLGSGSSAEVAAHELLHNLGAVPDQAPNECPATQGHVCDSSSDVMYPYLSQGSTLDSVTLDVGRNDYYGHGQSWWDVRNSDWLEHLPQFALSLDLQGSGTLSARAGTLALPCDSGCDSLILDSDTTVSVNALPAAGWKFADWTGSCSGTSPSCTLAISAVATATATFVKVTVRATVAITGKGKVTSSPAGVTCPGLCTSSFTTAPVRLTAKPAPGWRFAGWRGACAGRKACTLASSARVRALFARR